MYIHINNVSKSMSYYLTIESVLVCPMSHIPLLQPHTHTHAEARLSLSVSNQSSFLHRSFGQFVACYLASRQQRNMIYHIQGMMSHTPTFIAATESGLKNTFKHVFVLLLLLMLLLLLLLKMHAIGKMKNLTNFMYFYASVKR